MEESLEWRETERDMSVFVNMNVLPLPIIDIRRDLGSKEVISLSHSSSHVIHAVLLALILFVGTSAYSVELFILRVCLKSVDHSLNEVNEWVVSNHCKSDRLIWDLLGEQGLIELYLPGGKNSSSNTLFRHVPIPIGKSVESLLSLVSTVLIKRLEHLLGELGYHRHDITGHEVYCIVLDCQHVLVIKLVTSIDTLLDQLGYALGSNG